jgi:Lon protease-like protein
MSTSVRVNFNLPVPLFPLPETILLPQSVAPIHIFEPRYRQMVEHALGRAGQIAMACFADASWQEETSGPLPLRPVVCLGQIVQHERVGEGFQIVLHGLCRARILNLIEPHETVLYRAATLRPLPIDQPQPAQLDVIRAELESLLCDTDLNRLEPVAMVRTCLDNQEIDTTTLLEIIAASLVHDPDLRYAILAEGSVGGRADLVRQELHRLEHLLLLAYRQKRRREDYQVTVN